VLRPQFEHVEDGTVGISERRDVGDLDITIAPRFLVPANDSDFVQQPPYDLRPHEGIPDHNFGIYDNWTPMQPVIVRDRNLEFIVWLSGSPDPTVYAATYQQFGELEQSRRTATAAVESERIDTDLHGS
jgi:hypothetical protein